MKKQLRNLNGVSKSDTKTIKLNQRKMLPDIDTVGPPGDSIISISSTTVEPYEDEKKDSMGSNQPSNRQYRPVRSSFYNIG